MCVSCPLQRISSLNTATKNSTTVTEFVLTGLSDIPVIRFCLFAAFLFIYLITLLGNGTILLAIAVDSRLHSPMYFFLSNLALIDVFCPTTTVPKMLDSLLTENNTISFTGCMLQLYFMIALAGTEVALLAVMSYDRYVAICSPLHYTAIMTKRLCLQMAATTWTTGFFYSMLFTVLTFTLPYCKSNRVNQYYCDIPQMLALSCASAFNTEIIVFIVIGFWGVGAMLITMVSYVRIISTILRIRSAEGKRKAFSTCTSHLTVICLFYGSGISTYLRPSSNRRSDQDRVVAMLYGMFTPVLNPLIYSLRNKEVKGALKRIVQKWHGVRD